MPPDSWPAIRDQLCTFNDDIQGTAAVATATLISAINVTGIPLEQQKIVMVGFGTAGIGITNLLAQFMQDKGLTEAGSAQSLLCYRSLRPGHGKRQGCAARAATLCAQRTRSAGLEATERRDHPARRGPPCEAFGPHRGIWPGREPSPNKQCVKWQSIRIGPSSSRFRTPPRAAKRRLRT